MGLAAAAHSSSISEVSWAREPALTAAAHSSSIFVYTIFCISQKWQKATRPTLDYPAFFVSVHTTALTAATSTSSIS